MKKTLFLFGLIVTGSLAGVRFDATGAKAAENVMPANYINISASETHVIWVPHIYRDYTYDADEKYQIVFFDTNSKYEIASIEYINYTMKASDREHRSDGQVNAGVNTLLEYRTDRQWTPLPIGNPLYFIKEYDYQNGSYVTTFDDDVAGDTVLYAYYRDVYRLNMPQLGKIDILKQTEQKLGSISSSLGRKLLFQYPTDKNGYDSVDSYLNLIRKNYEYYLIIPLSDETIKLDYISIKAYDIHGNVISNEIDGITPVPNEPEKYTFNVTKAEGEITQAGTAIHFPGTNRFKLTGLTLSGVIKEVSDPSVYSDVYVYAGNLIGKTTLVGVVDSINKAWKLTQGPKTITNYLFNGLNNSLLIDIPENVSSAVITIEYFKDVTVTHTGEDQPFLYNLLDKNGNYGIRGGNGELDPNLGKNWFEKWLSSLGINLGLGTGELGGVLSIALIAIGAILLIIVLIKFGGGGTKVKIINPRN